MSFGFKPEKINNPYALMAALAIVCGTILLKLMHESSTETEKIITGAFTVTFFVFFLLIIYKILTHENKSVDTLDKELLARQVKLAMIVYQLKEMKKSSIEKQDLVAVQQPDFMISNLEKNQILSYSELLIRVTNKIRN